MGATTRSGRAGRARIGDLFLYDLILLLVVVGLLWAERELARSATAAEQKSAPPPPSAPTTPPPERPPSGPTRPVRVTTEAPPPATDAGATRREVEAVVAAARGASDAGRPDEALATLAGADPRLRAAPEWAELAEPLAATLREKVAAQDAWRAVLADAQVLADQGDVQGVEALLRRAGAAPRLERERERARARAAAKPGGGFQIRGFTPDQERVEGRRCTVEGPLERARLLDVCHAVDALLSQAETSLGEGLGDKLVLKVLGEDAAAEAQKPLEVSTHAREDDAPGDLVARARLLAARAAVAEAAPRATAGAREALVHALAGAEPSGRDPRPRLTSLGLVWRRRALDGATADALVAAWRGDAAPDLAFALGFAALWGGPAAEPLRRALAAARDGAATPLAPDVARALAQALPTLLETS